MPDGDDIDDIEEESVNDDSQQPRTWVQLTCWTDIFRRFWGIFLMWKVKKEKLKNHLRNIKSISVKRMV
jgi:hypothetical protein